MSGPVEISEEHVQSTCKPGQGEETCAFLTMAPDVGWQCAKGEWVESAIRARLFAGTMKSRGDNCAGWDAETGRPR